MSLNDKQSEAIECVLTGHNLLLLGAAGTGKTFLIKHIVRQLKSLNKCVFVTATTGIACCLYDDASTIHRWSGICDGRHNVSEIRQVVQNNVMFKDARTRILETDVLIIDECSMLSKKFFECLNEVCKIRNDSRLFGGIQLIMTGDFRQLPPVPNPLYGETGEFCFESSIFKDVLSHRITLTQVIRQTETMLIEAIREVSAGTVSDKTAEYIESLNRPLTENSKTVKLFSRNEQVDDFNRKSIVEFCPNDQLYQYQSKDEGDSVHLNKMLAPKTLWLKKGAPVMLLRNLSDKLVNGLCGQVCDITEEGPVIEFPSLNVKIPIVKIRFSVFSPTRNMDVAVRMQYPLKLSFAISIHKSQGLTIDSLEVDCRQIFKPGQLGVALGRTRGSSSGLRVTNFNRQQSVIQQPEVVQNFLSQDDSVKDELLEDQSCCRMKLERYFS